MPSFRRLLIKLFKNNRRDLLLWFISHFNISWSLGFFHLIDIFVSRLLPNDTKVKGIICLSCLSDDSNLRLLFKQCWHFPFHFAYIGHRLKFMLPILSHENGILLDLVICDRKSLAVGKIDDICHLFWIQGIPDIEHVFSATSTSSWIFVWKQVSHSRLSNHPLV